MTEQPLLYGIDGHGVATLTLNRPRIHNCYDQEMIESLTERLHLAERDRDVRILVLRGRGESFSAGADLHYMKAVADYSQSDNFSDAMELATLMKTLNRFPKPTVALVHGVAIGGGVGLIACCDIAVASDATIFALAEVRLGLIPAAISPYVVDTIGARAARRYFLTGERFYAAEARRIGLVHEIAPDDQLEDRLGGVLAALQKGGPSAQLAAKRLIETVRHEDVDDGLVEETAHRIARIRASDEGHEGIVAFLEKRKPSWQKT